MHIKRFRIALEANDMGGIKEYGNPGLDLKDDLETILNDQYLKRRSYRLYL